MDSVRQRLRDAIGIEREDALATHAAMSASTALPPASHQAADFLRAYLTGDPPKRWYGFKGQRRRLYAPIADDIRALFEAHRHARHAAIDALPALWARLQR